MAIIKETKDHLIKLALGKASVPRGLYDVSEYFRLYDPINFKVSKKNGYYTAVSRNYRWGSIVTEGDTLKELDSNIKDAILTVFEVPSSYAKEAGIENTSKANTERKYALA